MFSRKKSSAEFDIDFDEVQRKVKELEKQGYDPVQILGKVLPSEYISARIREQMQLLNELHKKPDYSRIPLEECTTVRDSLERLVYDDSLPCKIKQFIGGVFRRR